jgi:hypothetical protein
MKHDADERAVDVHAATVVVDKAQVPEPIHEKADSGAGCADHLGEGLLAHFRNKRNRLPAHPPSACRKTFRSVALRQMLLPRGSVSTLGRHFSVENRRVISPTPSVLPQSRCMSRLRTPTSSGARVRGLLGYLVTPKFLLSISQFSMILLLW